MSYRFYAQKRNPAALWVLDDTAPFDQQAGTAYSGTTAPGSSAPTTAPPLVVGADYASVFNNASQARFETPVFKQGKEHQPFTLEAWALPVLASKGHASQPPVNNLLKYGRGEGVAFRTNNAANWTSESDSTRAYVGSSSRKFKVVRAGGDPFAVSMYSVGHEYNQVDSPKVTAGVTYTAGFYVYTAQTNMKAYVTFNVRDSSNAIISGTQLSSPTVPLVANSWTRVEATWTPTATGVLSLGGMVNSVSGADIIPEGTETWVDAAYFYEGNFPNVGYTDGEYPGYAWTGAPGLSESYAKPDVSRVNLIRNPSCNVNHVGWSGTGVAGRVVAPWDSTKFAFRTIGVAGATPYIFSALSTRLIEKGTTVTARAMVKIPPNMKCYFRIHKRNPNTYFGGQAYGAPFVAGFTGVMTHTFTLTEDIAAGNLDVAVVFMDKDNVINNVAGKEFFMGDVFLEIGSEAGDYYDGDSPAARWLGAAGDSSTEVLTTTAPQKVLSHDTRVDGLTITDTVAKFSVAFADGSSAECSYDIMDVKASHLAGTYTPQQISLYVDGILRATTNLTEDQVDSGFAPSDGYLYSGATASSQSVALNGVAIYGKTSDETYSSNFAAGRSVIGQNKTVLQFSGKSTQLSSENGGAYFNVLIDDRAEFMAGLLQNVSVSSTAVVPFEIDGISQPGVWSSGVPLDVAGVENLYGVAVEWSASGVIAEASLDGEYWTRINSGELVPVISQGMPTAGATLEVRFTFAGGRTEDPSYLESVRFIGFSDNTVRTSDVRTVTYTHPAVLREDYEPIEFRDSNGINLNGGSLIIGSDTSDEPELKKAIEVWVKPVVGQPVFSVSGTRYVNGAVSTAPLAVGQWSLVHIVLPAAVSTGLTISGDAIVGQVTLYEDLTAGQISTVYKTYFGAETVRITDPAAGIGMSEPANAVRLYTHDWSLDGGNG